MNETISQLNKIIELLGKVKDDSTEAGRTLSKFADNFPEGGFHARNTPELSSSARETASFAAAALSQIEDMLQDTSGVDSSAFSASLQYAVTQLTDLVGELKSAAVAVGGAADSAKSATPPTGTIVHVSEKTMERVKPAEKPVAASSAVAVSKSSREMAQEVLTPEFVSSLKTEFSAIAAQIGYTFTDDISVGRGTLGGHNRYNKTIDLDFAGIVERFFNNLNRKFNPMGLITYDDKSRSTPRDFNSRDAEESIRIVFAHEVAHAMELPDYQDTTQAEVELSTRQVEMAVYRKLFPDRPAPKPTNFGSFSLGSLKEDKVMPYSMRLLESSPAFFRAQRLDVGQLEQLFQEVDEQVQLGWRLTSRQEQGFKRAQRIYEQLKAGVNPYLPLRAGNFTPFYEDNLAGMSTSTSTYSNAPDVGPARSRGLSKRIAAGGITGRRLTEKDRSVKKPVVAATEKKPEVVVVIADEPKPPTSAVVISKPERTRFERGLAAEILPEKPMQPIIYPLDSAMRARFSISNQVFGKVFKFDPNDANTPNFREGNNAYLNEFVSLFGEYLSTIPTERQTPEQLLIAEGNIFKLGQIIQKRTDYAYDEKGLNQQVALVLREAASEMFSSVGFFREDEGSVVSDVLAGGSLSVALGDKLRKIVRQAVVNTKRTVSTQGNLPPLSDYFAEEIAAAFSYGTDSSREALGETVNPDPDEDLNQALTKRFSSTFQAMQSFMQSINPRKGEGSDSPVGSQIVGFKGSALYPVAFARSALAKTSALRDQAQAQITLGDFTTVAVGGQSVSLPSVLANLFAPAIQAAKKASTYSGVLGGTLAGKSYSSMFSGAGGPEQVNNLYAAELINDYLTHGQLVADPEFFVEQLWGGEGSVDTPISPADLFVQQLLEDLQRQRTRLEKDAVRAATAESRTVINHRARQVKTQIEYIKKIISPETSSEERAYLVTGVQSGAGLSVPEALSALYGSHSQTVFEAAAPEIVSYAGGLLASLEQHGLTGRERPYETHSSAVYLANAVAAYDPADYKTGEAVGKIKNLDRSGITQAADRTPGGQPYAALEFFSDYFGIGVQRGSRGGTLAAAQIASAYLDEKGNFDVSRAREAYAENPEMTRNNLESLFYAMTDISRRDLPIVGIMQAMSTLDRDSQDYLLEQMSQSAPGIAEILKNPRARVGIRAAMQSQSSAERMQGILKAIAPLLQSAYVSYVQQLLKDDSPEQTRARLESDRVDPELLSLAKTYKMLSASELENPNNAFVQGLTYIADGASSAGMSASALDFVAEILGTEDQLTEVRKAQEVAPTVEELAQQRFSVSQAAGDQLRQVTGTSPDRYTARKKRQLLEIANLEDQLAVAQAEGASDAAIKHLNNQIKQARASMEAEERPMAPIERLEARLANPNLDDSTKKALAAELALRKQALADYGFSEAGRDEGFGTDSISNRLQRKIDYTRAIRALPEDLRDLYRRRDISDTAEQYQIDQQIAARVGKLTKEEQAAHDTFALLEAARRARAAGYTGQNAVVYARGSEGYPSQGALSFDPQAEIGRTYPVDSFTEEVLQGTLLAQLVNGTEVSDEVYRRSEYNLDALLFRRPEIDVVAAADSEKTRREGIIAARIQTPDYGQNGQRREIAQRRRKVKQQQKEAYARLTSESSTKEERDLSKEELKATEQELKELEEQDRKLRRVAQYAAVGVDIGQLLYGSEVTDKKLSPMSVSAAMVGAFGKSELPPEVLEAQKELKRLEQQILDKKEEAERAKTEKQRKIEETKEARKEALAALHADPNYTNKHRVDQLDAQLQEYEKEEDPAILEARLAGINQQIEYLRFRAAAVPTEALDKYYARRRAEFRDSVISERRLRQYARLGIDPRESLLALHGQRRKAEHPETQSVLDRLIKTSTVYQQLQFGLEYSDAEMESLLDDLLVRSNIAETPLQEFTQEQRDFQQKALTGFLERATQGEYALPADFDEASNKAALQRLAGKKARGESLTMQEQVDYGKYRKYERNALVRRFHNVASSQPSAEPLLQFLQILYGSLPQDYSMDDDPEAVAKDVRIRTLLSKIDGASTQAQRALALVMSPTSSRGALDSAIAALSPSEQAIIKEAIAVLHEETNPGLALATSDIGKGMRELSLVNAVEAASVEATADRRATANYENVRGERTEHRNYANLQQRTRQEEDAAAAKVHQERLTNIDWDTIDKYNAVMDTRIVRGALRNASEVEDAKYRLSLVEAREKELRDSLNKKQSSRQRKRARRELSRLSEVKISINAQLVKLGKFRLRQNPVPSYGDEPQYQSDLTTPQLKTRAAEANQALKEMTSLPEFAWINDSTMELPSATPATAAGRYWAVTAKRNRLEMLKKQADELREQLGGRAVPTKAKLTLEANLADVNKSIAKFTAEIEQEEQSFNEDVVLPMWEDRARGHRTGNWLPEGVDEAALTPYDRYGLAYSQQRAAEHELAARKVPRRRIVRYRRSVAEQKGVFGRNAARAERREQSARNPLSAEKQIILRLNDAMHKWQLFTKSLVGHRATAAVEAALSPYLARLVRIGWRKKEAEEAVYSSRQEEQAKKRQEEDSTLAELYPSMGPQVVGFDLETTIPKPGEAAKILQFAAVGGGKNLAGKFKTETMNVEQGAGGAELTAEQQEDAKQLLLTAAKMGLPIIGHNIKEFDLPILFGGAENVPSIISSNAIDTLQMARELQLPGSYTLGSLARLFGLEYDPSRLHEAEYDTQLNVLLYDKLEEAKRARNRDADKFSKDMLRQFFDRSALTDEQKSLLQPLVTARGGYDQARVKQTSADMAYMLAHARRLDSLKSAKVDGRGRLLLSDAEGRPITDQDYVKSVLSMFGYDADQTLTNEDLKRMQDEAAVVTSAFDPYRVDGSLDTVYNLFNSVAGAVNSSGPAAAGRGRYTSTAFDFLRKLLGSSPVSLAPASVKEVVKNWRTYSRGSSTERVSDPVAATVGRLGSLLADATAPTTTARVRTEKRTDEAAGIDFKALRLSRMTADAARTMTTLEEADPIAQERAQVAQSNYEEAVRRQNDLVDQINNVGTVDLSGNRLRSLDRRIAAEKLAMLKEPDTATAEEEYAAIQAHYDRLEQSFNKDYVEKPKVDASLSKQINFLNKELTAQATKELAEDTAFEKQATVAGQKRALTRLSNNLTTAIAKAPESERAALQKQRQVINTQISQLQEVIAADPEKATRLLEGFTESDLTAFDRAGKIELQIGGLEKERSAQESAVQSYNSRRQELNAWRRAASRPKRTTKKWKKEKQLEIDIVTEMLQEAETEGDIEKQIELQKKLNQLNLDLKMGRDNAQSLRVRPVSSRLSMLLYERQKEASRIGTARGLRRQEKQARDDVDKARIARDAAVDKADVISKGAEVSAAAYEKAKAERSTYSAEEAAKTAALAPEEPPLVVTTVVEPSAREETSEAIASVTAGKRRTLRRGVRRSGVGKTTRGTGGGEGDGSSGGGGSGGGGGVRAAVTGGGFSGPVTINNLQANTVDVGTVSNATINARTVLIQLQSGASLGSIEVKQILDKDYVGPKGRSPLTVEQYQAGSVNRQTVQGAIGATFIGTGGGYGGGGGYSAKSEPLQARENQLGISRNNFQSRIGQFAGIDDVTAQERIKKETQDFVKESLRLLQSDILQTDSYTAGTAADAPRLALKQAIDEMIDPANEAAVAANFGSRLEAISTLATAYVDSLDALSLPEETQKTIKPEVGEINRTLQSVRDQSYYTTSAVSRNQADIDNAARNKAREDDAAAREAARVDEAEKRKRDMSAKESRTAAVLTAKGVLGSARTAFDLAGGEVNGQSYAVGRAELIKTTVDSLKETTELDNLSTAVAGLSAAEPASVHEFTDALKQLNDAADSANLTEAAAAFAKLTKIAADLQEAIPTSAALTDDQKEEAMSALSLFTARAAQTDYIKPTAGVIEATERKRMSVLEEQLQAAASRPGFFGLQRDATQRRLLKEYAQERFGQAGADIMYNNRSMRFQARTEQGGRIDLIEASSEDLKRLQEDLSNAGAPIGLEELQKLQNVMSRTQQTRNQTPFADPLFFAASRIRDIQTLGMTAMSALNLPSTIAGVIDQAASPALNAVRSMTSLRGLSRDQGVFNKAVAAASEQQALFGGSLTSNIGSITSFIPLTNAYGVDISQVVNVARKLAAFDPAQGMEGASIAIKEFLSGNVASLSRRFEINRSALSKIDIGNATEMLNSLDEVLAQMGVTDQLINEAANSRAAQYDKMLGRLETMGIKVSEFAVGAATPLLESVLGSNSFLGKMADTTTVNLMRDEGLKFTGSAALSKLADVDMYAPSLSTFTRQVDTVFQEANDEIAAAAASYQKTTGVIPLVSPYRLLENMKPEERVQFRNMAQANRLFKGMTTEQALMQASRDMAGDYASYQEFVNQRKLLPTDRMTYEQMTKSDKFKELKADAEKAMIDEVARGAGEKFRPGILTALASPSTFLAGSLLASGVETATRSGALLKRATIGKVTDLDTFRTAGGERIRLVGVDAPETGSKAAVKAMAQAVEVGLRENENITYEAGGLDKYGRTLAVVYNEQGQMINSELIARGIAGAMTDSKAVNAFGSFVADQGMGVINEAAAKAGLGGLPVISDEVKKAYYMQTYFGGIGGTAGSVGTAVGGGMLTNATIGALAGSKMFAGSAAASAAAGAGIAGTAGLVALGAGVAAGGYALITRAIDLNDVSVEKMRELYKMQAEFEKKQRMQNKFDAVYLSNAGFSGERETLINAELMKTRGRYIANTNISEALAASGLTQAAYEKAATEIEKLYNQQDQPGKDVLGTMVLSPDGTEMVSLTEALTQSLAFAQDANLRDTAVGKESQRLIGVGNELIDNADIIQLAQKYGLGITPSEIGLNNNQLEALGLLESPSVLGRDYRDAAQAAQGRSTQLTATQMARFLTSEQIKTYSDAMRQRLLNDPTYQVQAKEYMDQQFDQELQRKQQRFNTFAEQTALNNAMGLFGSSGPLSAPQVMTSQFMLTSFADEGARSTLNAAVEESIKTFNSVADHNRAMAELMGPYVSTFQTTFANYVAGFSRAGSGAEALRNYMSNGDPMFALNEMRRISGLDWRSMINQQMYLPMQLNSQSLSQFGYYEGRRALQPSAPMFSTSLDPLNGYQMPYTSGPRGRLAYANMIASTPSIRQLMSPADLLNVYNTGIQAQTELAQRNLQHNLQMRDLARNHNRSLEDITRNAFRQLESIHLNATRQMTQAVQQRELSKRQSLAQNYSSIGSADLTEKDRREIDVVAQAGKKFADQAEQSNPAAFLRFQGRLESENTRLLEQAFNAYNAIPMENVGARESAWASVIKYRDLVTKELEGQLVGASPEDTSRIRSQMALLGRDPERGAQAQQFVDQRIGTMTQQAESLKALQRQKEDLLRQQSYAGLERQSLMQNMTAAQQSGDPLQIQQAARALADFDLQQKRLAEELQLVSRRIENLANTAPMWSDYWEVSYSQIEETTSTTMSGLINQYEDFNISLKQQIEDALLNLARQKEDIVRSFTDAAIEIATQVPATMAKGLTALIAYTNDMRAVEAYTSRGDFDTANALAYAANSRLALSLYGDSNSPEAKALKSQLSFDARPVPGSLDIYSIDTPQGKALKVYMVSSATKTTRPSSGPPAQIEQDYGVGIIGG